MNSQHNILRDAGLIPLVCALTLSAGAAGASAATKPNPHNFVKPNPHNFLKHPMPHNFKPAPASDLT